jgi:pyridoxal phosphate enzyme (YggS family)
VTDSTLRLAQLRRRIEAAASTRIVMPRLLAVSKTWPASAIRALAEAGQTAFGENYIQEAVAKRAELGDLALQWHFIGPLQSNKCRLAAQHFDWVESIDRSKLVPLLAQSRAVGRAPLNVLIQVNVDDESSKSGCRADEIEALAIAITAAPTLSLRGLMAIPAPSPDVSTRRHAFRRMRALFDTLASQHDHIDTLSMGMSDDFELAIEEGATQVRVGSVLFGARSASGQSH